MSKIISLIHQAHVVELVGNTIEVIAHTRLGQEVALLLMNLRGVNLCIRCKAIGNGVNEC